MRLRIPSGCGAATHDGRMLDIGTNISVEVGEDVAQALLAHGFAPMDEADAARGTSPAPLSGPSQIEAVHPLEVEIGELNRRALFAFLKARHVPVSLPVTNEELRSLARRAATSLNPEADDVSKGS